MSFLRTLPAVAFVIVLFCSVGTPAVHAQAPPDSTASSLPNDDTPGMMEQASGADTLKVVLEDDRPYSHGVPMSKNPTGAVLRSVVLPGWGQAYTENWIKAIVFAGVDAGLIYGVYVQHDRYTTALDKSRSTKTEAEREILERSANFYRDDRNKLLWYVAGVTILSSLDAYVEAHLYDFHIDPILETPPNNDGVTAGIRITFTF